MPANACGSAGRRRRRRLPDSPARRREQGAHGSGGHVGAEHAGPDTEQRQAHAVCEDSSVPPALAPHPMRAARQSPARAVRPCTRAARRSRPPSAESPRPRHPSTWSCPRRVAVSRASSRPGDTPRRSAAPDRPYERSAGPRRRARRPARITNHGSFGSRLRGNSARACVGGRYSAVRWSVRAPGLDVGDDADDGPGTALMPTSGRGELDRASNARRTRR